MAPTRRIVECQLEHMDPSLVQMGRVRFDELMGMEQEVLRVKADASQRVADAERRANDALQQAANLMTEAGKAQRAAIDTLQSAADRTQTAVAQERESAAKAQQDAVAQLKEANALLLDNLKQANVAIDKLRSEGLEAINRYATLHREFAGVLATRAEGQEKIELKKLEVEGRKIEAEASAAFQSSILTQLSLLGQSFVSGMRPKLLGGGAAVPAPSGRPVDAQSAPAPQAEQVIPDNPVIAHPQISEWKEVTARVLVAMPDSIAMNLCWIIAVNRILDQPMAQIALGALPPDLAQAFVQLTQMAVAQAPAQAPQPPKESTPAV
jgi:hypothetical protein